MGYAIYLNFNPLPPQGGRLPSAPPAFVPDAISIHSLPKEGDIIPKIIATAESIFQSTPSPRRETS